MKNGHGFMVALRIEALKVQVFLIQGSCILMNFEIKNTDVSSGSKMVTLEMILTMATKVI